MSRVALRVVASKGVRVRLCSKPGCTRGAVATLTYDYQDQTAVLGPLAMSVEPHTYDLCEVHAESLTVPRGWQVVRLQTHFEPAPPSGEDLLALVEAIRDVAGTPSPSTQTAVSPTPETATDHADEDGADKYAPLRRRDTFTVIWGEGD